MIETLSWAATGPERQLRSRGIVVGHDDVGDRTRLVLHKVQIEGRLVPLVVQGVRPCR